VRRAACPAPKTTNCLLPIIGYPLCISATPWASLGSQAGHGKPLPTSAPLPSQ
jgi:hypothetical protein